MNLTALKKTTRILAAFAVLLGAGISSGKAQLLFINNGAATASSPDAYVAESTIPFNMAGNVFTPLVSGSATTVAFWGIYSDTAPTSEVFTLSLYSTSGNAPATQIATTTLTGVTRTATGASLFGQPLYTYTGTLSTSFTLDSSLTYYLGFSDTGSEDAPFELALTGTPGPANIGYNRINATFNNISSDPWQSFAFSLSGPAAAPEPSSYAFGLIALGVLAFAVRLRHQQA